MHSCRSPTSYLPNPYRYRSFDQLVGFNVGEERLVTPRHSMRGLHPLFAGGGGKEGGFLAKVHHLFSFIQRTSRLMPSSSSQSIIFPNWPFYHASSAVKGIQRLTLEFHHAMHKQHPSNRYATIKPASRAPPNYPASSQKACLCYSSSTTSSARFGKISHCSASSSSSPSTRSCWRPARGRRAL